MKLVIWINLLNKYKSIPVTVKASIAYTICGILQNGLSVITMPIFTRLLTTEQYGQYNIYYSWSGILTLFITLNMWAGSFPKAMVKYEQNRDQYIASIQGICIILAGVFFLIYFPLRNILNRLFELPTFLIIVMVAEILGQVSLQFWSGKKRFQFKYISVVIVTLCISVIAPFAAYFLVVNTEEKGYARIVGYAAVYIAFGFFFMVYNWINGKTFYNKEYWNYTLSINLPLIIYYLSQVVFNQSDRIMISHFVGTDKAGIYGVAYSLAILLSFVLNSINNSYVPWFYEKLKEGKQEENRSIAVIISVIMAVLLLCVMWLSPEIILIMAGKEYTEAVWVVPPVAMSILLLFYSQLCINIEFYFEKKNQLLFASISAAVVNIVLNAICIPRMGFIAAGYTTLISYLIFFGSNYYAMAKILKEKGVPNNSFDLKIMLLILFVFTAIGFLGMALYSMLFVRLLIMAIVFIILLINYKFVLSNIKKILSFKAE